MLTATVEAQADHTITVFDTYCCPKCDAFMVSFRIHRLIGDDIGGHICPRCHFQGSDEELEALYDEQESDAVTD